MRDKYISADKLNDLLDELTITDGVYNAIQALPAADGVEVKRGKWDVGYFHDRVCSCCTHPDNDLDDFPHDYCPNCGARMDGDNNGK